MKTWIRIEDDDDDDDEDSEKEEILDWRKWRIVKRILKEKQKKKQRKNIECNRPRLRTRVDRRQPR